MPKGDENLYHRGLTVVTPEGVVYRSVTEEDLRAAVGDRSYPLVEVDTRGLSYATLEELTQPVQIVRVRDGEVGYGVGGYEVLHIGSVEDFTAWVDLPQANWPPTIYLVKLGQGLVRERAGGQGDPASVAFG